MTDKYIRDIVNLLIYGGTFIGLCAACITALTFELIGNAGQGELAYIILIGTSTAALYSGHRVLGLHKLSHIVSIERFTVIRKYRQHIWVYCSLWACISIWMFIPMASIEFAAWLVPGGIIAVTYVIPVLSGGRRIRDLGWMKIILIGWSWAWLTAFIPALYIAKEPLVNSIFLGIGRMIFIVAITIPFEIRDISIDRSIGVMTMPVYFGVEKTLQAGKILCIILLLFVAINSIHYHDLAFGISMSLISMLTIWIIRKSQTTYDDYFFSGLTDGTMIVVLILYWVLEKIINVM